MAVTGKGDAPIGTVWVASQPRTFNQGQALLLLKQGPELGVGASTVMNDYFFNAVAVTVAGDEGALWYIPIQAEA